MYIVPHATGCLQLRATSYGLRLRAGLVFFTCSHIRTYNLHIDTQGGGEMELLEALACNAEVEVAADNAKLQSLLQQRTRVPDAEQYADELVKALWSVLIHSAVKI